MAFDVEAFRRSVPQLERTNGPRRLVYFDTGASSLKHSQVTDRVNSYNRFETLCICVITSFLPKILQQL